MSANLPLKLLPWFTGEFVKGRLPSAPEWAAQAAVSEETLLNWVLGQDPVLAEAAVAALVYGQGGDDAEAKAAAAQLLGHEYKLRAQMERDWREMKEGIFLESVRRSAGVFTLKAAVQNKGEKTWREVQAEKVPLVWQKDKLAAGEKAVPLQPDPIKKQVVMEDVSHLDRIGGLLRRELDILDLSGPVRFSPDRGAWISEWKTEDGKTVRVRFEPEPK